jgi:hypothetical protein
MIAKANETNSGVLENGERIAPIVIPAAPPAVVPPAVIPPVEGASNEIVPAVRPSWCPEEFWNAETGVADTEALGTKYTELAAPKAPIVPAVPPVEGALPDAPFVAAVDRANADLLAGGALTEEAYVGFEKIGLSREHVNGYMEGQQAKAQLIQMRVHGETGGEENLQRMIAWGVTTYTQTEADMFDKMLNSGNVEQAVGAVRGLQARYNQAEGTPGAIIVPSEGGAATVGGYTSKDEVVADMSKPEYRKNSKFRAEVQGKIDAALKAGVNLGF